MSNVCKHITKMQEQINIYPVKDGAARDPLGTRQGRLPAKIII
jgi:hypothetical protein